MPLIILTGYPCSGKTYRARQIQHSFESRTAQLADRTPKVTITYVPSHHALLDPPSEQEDSTYTAPERLNNPRDHIYNASRTEKTARAEEFSAIRRALSKNNIVIADGLNYIKGFRYQLWCEAKAASTRCVVVHVAAREDEVRSWNKQKLEAWDWPIEEDGKEDDSSGNVHMGPKIGRNVMGDLMPESHTAIFGDKMVDYNGGTRSRSSSMGGGASDDEDGENNTNTLSGNHSPADDTMTLKSLYISDRPDAATHSIQHNSEATGTPAPQLDKPYTETITPTPTIPPPPPNASLPYSSATLTSLAMRYEPPSPFTRWDTPLFTIPTSDPNPDYTAIWNAIFPQTSTKPLSKKAQSQLPNRSHTTTSTTTQVPSVKPHAATVLPAATASSALQTLETTTAQLTKHILAASRAQSIGTPDGPTSGGTLTFSISPDDPGATLDLTVPPNLTLSQPVLQRLRRKYTQIQRGGIAHGVGHVSGREDVVAGFLAFLEAEWGV